jgi:hypothetical protein
MQSKTNQATETPEQTRARLEALARCDTCGEKMRAEIIDVDGIPQLRVSPAGGYPPK